VHQRRKSAPKRVSEINKEESATPGPVISDPKPGGNQDETTTGEDNNQERRKCPWIKSEFEHFTGKPLPKFPFLTST